MAQNSFKRIKKSLPGKYAEKVVELIQKQGFSINRQFVYDTVRGRKKESELTVRVWKAISELKKQQRKLRSKTKKLKAA